MILRPSDYDFRFESGRICLDFAATRASRHADALERWRDAADLGRWLAASGLASRAPGLGEADLATARALREAIYRTVSARRLGAPPAAADVRLINAHAADAPLAPRLDPQARTRSLTAGAPFEAALSTIARDAVDLVTGPGLGRVRECDEHTCSILFVDTSRPGKRRWCSMNRCGNRIKKAAFRARHRET